jgi:O-antigen ligase
MGLLIFILPTALAAIPKGGSIVVLMLILSVVGLTIKRERMELNKWEKYFVLSFVFYFFVVAVNLWWFDGKLHDLDTPSRLLLVLPIFFFIRKFNINSNWFIWGVVVTSLMVGINQVAVYFNYNTLYFFQDNSGIMTLFASILGLMSLLFMSTEKSKIANFLFFSVAILGITASFLLGGRGVWIAAIMSLVFIGLVNPMSWSGGARVFIIGLFVSVFIATYLVPQTGVKDRLTQATSNVAQWSENGKSSTSAGARLEMWKASYHVIKENPFFGVGEDNYSKYQQILINQGKVSKAVEGFLHPHGEYVTSLVEQGFIGLLAFISVLLAPLTYLLCRIKSNKNSYRLKVLTTSGLLIILHYAVYSVTSGVFDHQSTALFYSVFMATILGLIKSNSRIEV